MKIVVASNSSNTRRSRLALAGRVWAPLVVAIFFGVANASFGQAPSSSDANAYSSPNAGSQPQNQSGAAQGQSQSGAAQGQSQSETPDAAAPQIAQFFRVAGSREIQGEALTLERLLYGVYSPADRNRRLAAYWDLAGRNAQYNLCVVCSGYVEECAGKLAQQANSSEETRNLITSVRQIAFGRQSAARVRLLQGQYEFDAAFTTAAGRRAALQRASESGVRAVDANSGVVFYIPSARPATDVYRTRFAEIAPYISARGEAARLNTLTPLLYETLQARATQTARELDVLVSLANSTQLVPTTLFAAIESYRNSASQMIDAAVRYNQAIAAYSSLVTPANIQGAAFLATINQRPSAQTQPSQQRQQQNGAGAPQQGSAAAGADAGTPRSDVPTRFAYYLPGYLPEWARETPEASSQTQPASSQTVADATSDAAQIEAASLASIQPLAPASLPIANAKPVVARNLDSEATFTPVAYSRPISSEPTATLVPASASPEPEPTPAAPAETVAASENKATPEATSEPEQTTEPAPNPEPQPEPASVAESKPEPLPQPEPTPEQPEAAPDEATPDQSVQNQPELPIIIVITGYEQPLKSDVESAPVETEQATASDPSTSPDGAWLSPLRVKTRVALFAAALRSIFTTSESDVRPSTLSDEYVVRGQDISLPDDYNAEPAPQADVVNTTSGAVNTASSDATQRAAAAAQVRALTTALFAIETPPAPATGERQEDAYERLYTLHEVASRSNQSPTGRRAVAFAFWKLQGACARLRVEETIFRNFTLVYNNLDSTTINNEVGRACLAAALEQQARVTEAKTLKRAAQIELLGCMGRSSANSALPLPATLPFCDAQFKPSLPGYADARTLRTAALVQARLKSVQEFGATLEAPNLLLNVDTNNVSASNVELLVATLQKKRESALLFVDHVVALNFAVADSVAFFPAQLSSDQFVDALAGRR